MFGDMNAIDDAFSYNETQKMKIKYLNILVVGGQKTGKFYFTKFLFENCFKKQFEIDSVEKTFRDFVHRIQNGRRGTRVLSITHSKGYSEEYEIREWYKNIKQLLISKMESYEEIRQHFEGNKNFFNENLQDTRIHLCLFFMQSTEISMLEMLYMQKLSRYVNILPILIQRNPLEKFNYENIKLEAKRVLDENNVEWFDLQEDDLAFR